MDNDKYKKEVEEKWGNTEAYKQSKERTRNWTEEDYAKIKTEQDEVLRGIVSNMHKGIESKEIGAFILRWRDGINKFYNTTPEICRGLANMYVKDERFADFYKKYDKDLPQFMHDAIYFHCNVSSK